MSEAAKTGARRRFVAGGLFLIAMIVAVWTLPLDVWLDAAAVWIAEHPTLGRALFVAGFTVGTALMVPGSVLTMSGGYLFGLAGGVPLVSLGTALGGTLSYLVGRTVAREWVQQKVAGDRRIAALDQAIAHRGFVVVMLTRLSLLLPFNLLNYAYGLTRIRLVPYFFATWIGMIPAVTLYVYLGSVAKNVDQLVDGDVEAGIAGKLLFGAGLLAIVAVTWIIHRTATRALRREMGEDLE
ncbi:TVP38/TMEM64 family protein [Lentisalinibacter salinarum]|uniref:TVP38/TMEM64 family protein n=1 Tax=Lentisalinibacter salinarum TaxID=2992239 RepID=UPI003869D5C3